MEDLQETATEYTNPSAHLNVMKDLNWEVAPLDSAF